MVPKGRMRQSRSYDSLLQNFPPPKSGIGCDTCGRRIAVSVPDPSTGGEDAIETLRDGYRSGGRKKARQSRQSEHFIRDVGIRRVQICPESRLAGRRTANQKERWPPTLDKGRGTGAICAGRLRFSQGDRSEAPPSEHQFASALRAVDKRQSHGWMVLTTAPTNVACQLSPASAFDREWFPESTRPKGIRDLTGGMV